MIGKVDEKRRWLSLESVIVTAAAIMFVYMVSIMLDLLAARGHFGTLSAGDHNDIVDGLPNS